MNPRRTPIKRRQAPAPKPRHARILVFIVAIAIVIGLFLLLRIMVKDDTASGGYGIKNANGSQQQGQNPSQPQFNKTKYSTTDPSSIWVVANKQHQLAPKDYVPGDLVIPNIPLRFPGNESMKLRKEAATALEQLAAAAKKDGLDMMLGSGYRSYGYQVALYNSYVKANGQAETDKTSARAGHSEHQTGWAADIEPASRKCEIEVCFGDLPEGKWLKDHAHEHGFIIRYPADKANITGYEYEPWHLRYVGTELSNEMHSQNITTLEEFFSITGGRSY